MQVFTLIKKCIFHFVFWGKRYIRHVRPQWDTGLDFFQNNQCKHNFVLKDMFNTTCLNRLPLDWWHVNRLQHGKPPVLLLKCIISLYQNLFEVVLFLFVLIFFLLFPFCSRSFLAFSRSYLDLTAAQVDLICTVFSESLHGLSESNTWHRGF